MRRITAVATLARAWTTRFDHGLAIVATGANAIVVVILIGWLSIGCGKRIPPEPAAKQSPQPARGATTGSLPAPQGIAGAAPGTNKPADSGQTTRSEALAPPARTEAAEALIDRVLSTYAQAAAYSDQATLTLRFPQGSELVSDTTQMPLVFTRPNQVALDIVSADNRVRIRGDGKQLTTQVVDPGTADFDHQIVARPQAARLSIADLYAATELVDPAAPGQMPSLLLGLPIRLEFGPLGLLLQEAPFVEFLRTAAAEVGSGEAIDGRSCDVLHVGRGSTAHQLWIDRETHQVRRIAYPAPVPPADAATESAPPRMELFAEFKQVAWQTPPAISFAGEFSQEAATSRYFVLPPIPLPTQKLGQVIKPLSFQDLYDRTVSSADWQEQVVVLTWFNNHPASQAALAQLQQVYERFRAEPRVHINVICVDPIEAMSHAELAKLLLEWQIDVVPLRDRIASGRDQLGIGEAPTTVVLQRDGTLHMYQVGTHPDLGHETAVVIERLLDGQDVARDVLARVDQYRQAYRQALAAARPDQPVVTAIPPPQTALADPRAARELKLREVWTSHDLPEPGNIVPIGEGAKARLLVLNGWREVVEFSPAGEVIQRHLLAIPADSGIAFFRSFTDSAGKLWYAAAARGGAHAFVFDQNWQTELQYPSQPDPEAAVADVQLGDLDQNGRPELYVGWQGLAGVHRVELDGKRVWSNRSITNVLSVTVARKSAGISAILVTGEQGIVGIIQEAGQTIREIPAEPHAWHQLLAARTAADAVSDYCGLSFTVEGRLLAFGLDRNLRPLWNYPLPLGTHRYQVDAMQSAEIWPDRSPQWLFAGPDGSVHCVSGDGEFADSFALGEHIAGIAALQDAERQRHLLVVATAKSIRAWNITAPRPRPALAP